MTAWAGVATHDCTPSSAEEFRYGGYEIDEAHRYYGMPAPFAPGAAESLTQLAAGLAGRV